MLNLATPGPHGSSYWAGVAGDRHEEHGDRVDSWDRGSGPEIVSAD